MEGLGSVCDRWNDFLRARMCGLGPVDTGKESLWSAVKDVDAAEGPTAAEAEAVGNEESGSGWADDDGLVQKV